ncbi:LysR family transcriptional regulator [Allostella sp. ATCC 35155]|nr:LysR family transcriptional regulator [Stella sp. ATCC 35155]
MNRRLPSLNALRCFEVVAAQLSIRKAAAILHVSESAVSRQVRILEDQLGAALFVRTPAGLAITEPGRRLAAETRAAFDRIAAAVEPFQGDRDAVRVKVLPTFALRWLLPRLHGFQAQHPLVRIAVQTRLEDMAPGDGDADLGIRYGLGDWPADCAVELYPEWIHPVCAPACRAAQGGDLAGATLLHPMPDRRDWRIWAEAAGQPPDRALDMSGGLDFDALDMALSAAEAGLGVAMTDVVLAEPAVAAGRLVAVAPAVATGISYWLVRPPGRARRQVRLFEEWLLREIAAARAIVARHRDGREHP